MPATRHIQLRARPSPGFWLDFRAVYGPFSVSVSLMMWAFSSGLLMLAGAHYSASRHALRLAREAEPGTVEFDGRVQPRKH